MNHDHLVRSAMLTAIAVGALGAFTRAPAQEGGAEPAQGRAAPAQVVADDPQAAPAADTEAADRGKALYSKVGCFECHGTVGQGGIGPMAGPRIAHADLPLEGFAYILRNPISAMPPYSIKVLTDQQVRDIHAYLAGAFTPARAADIPMLAKP